MNMAFEVAPFLPFRYPEELPVTARRADFLQLLQNHPVVIVQADTGSGKSTQIPKMCLESGLALHGRIGMTQPRRIAALTIADRLREELANADLVSTRIRFLEEGEKNAPIKIMTDGILLQEYRRDRLLRQYACIVLDEAHERSLNIDILLGILRGVCAQRKEFRLVVASATIDAKLFADFFPGSAILQAEGRLFPVEVFYRPPLEKSKGARGDSGLLEEAAEAICEQLNVNPDNLLAFLPTERDILDLAADLQGRLDSRFDVLPLFGRMSPAEQRRVFYGAGKIRVVLATNIAETSLTIPGIAHVIDTGQARISRYLPQQRIQALPVEGISRAAAEQRKGRAGRVKKGTCVRLYSQQELEERPQYTEPEIRRCNLANVVLQLRSLGIDLDVFPFLQSPPRAAFRGAYRQLHELGALCEPEGHAALTPFGREMSRLPLDVSLSAVLLRARENGVLQPAIIVSAGLCLQDTRVLPAEEPERGRARLAHKKFQAGSSDFLSLLALWNFVQENWKYGSSLRQLRKLCEDNWLHFSRLREWMDLFQQFCRILQVEFATISCPLKNFHADALHQTILYGFLGGLARRDSENNCYRIHGGREAHLFPGSALHGKSPEWVLAAELRETTRLFLSRAVEIRPEWVVRVAEPFCTKRWYEPVWNPQRGYVEVLEEISFRGMVLTRGRRVDYARIDPESCAEIFWREAIVEANWTHNPDFMRHNNRVLEKLRAAETRLRKWGLCPSSEQQVQWYRKRAAQVLSGKDLLEFLRAHGDNVLRFGPSDWVEAAQERAEAHRRPMENLALAQGLRARAHTVFDAASPEDGITLEIGLDAWEQLTPAGLALDLPRWRAWILDALFSGLPQKSRALLEPWRKELDSDWVIALGETLGEAPLLCLLRLFRARAECAELAIASQAFKETHLRLHLKLVDKPTGRIFPLELEPGLGHACVTAKLLGPLFAQINGRPVEPCVYGFIRNQNVSAYGWRLQAQGMPSIGWMPLEEARHWLEFRGQAEKGVLEESAKSWESLLRSVSTLLSRPISESQLHLAAGNLAAQLCHVEPSSLPSLSGLAALGERVVRDFRDLANHSMPDELDLRAEIAETLLALACVQPADFPGFWQKLSEVVGGLRRGKIDMENWRIFLQRCKSLPPSLWVRAALAQSEEKFLERMELWQEWETLLRRNLRSLPELARPLRANGAIAVHHQRSLRQALETLQNLQNKDWNLYLSAGIELESHCTELQIMLLRRPKGDVQEENAVVTSEDLQKLQNIFGKKQNKRKF